MANLTQLRLWGRQIFDEALRAVDAGEAVRRAVRLDDSSELAPGPALSIEISGATDTYSLERRNIYAIAIGKAAGKMMSALSQTLGSKLSGGVISTNHPTDLQIENSNCQVFNGGHPEPNEQSLAAAQAAFALLRRANQERAVVFFLVSGGGSAMMEWPLDDTITLDDLRKANRLLVQSGASIGEINMVRRGFSSVKGGRLVMLAPKCLPITLIVSDVPMGIFKSDVDAANVASGPSIPLKEPSADLGKVLERYDLREQLPETILKALSRRQGRSAKWIRPNYKVLLTNEDAVSAAAEAAKRFALKVDTATNISDEAIEDGCAKLLARLTTLRASTPAADTTDYCLISGGEFACPVRGDGIGGRNLESALRFALMASDKDPRLPFVALFAGTDGIDGNSPAAGAIVDSTTIERATSIGLNPRDFLDRSDSYSFFVALGDVIATGPTGTNVRDLRILLAARWI